MESIKKELIKRQNSYTVNSSNKHLNTDNSNTVEEEIEKLLREKDIKPEGIAMMLSGGLADPESLGYYHILCRENDSSKLLKALSLTKEADSQGKIRSKKAVYFLGILKKWGLKTKFKK